jgi:hypothetical protein
MRFAFGVQGQYWRSDSEAAAAIKRSPLDGCAESMDKEAASEACIRTTRSSKKGLETGT